MASKKSFFKWKHYESEIITLCVRWYGAYPLSYRHLVEMMEERGLRLAHTTIMRWVHVLGPELNKRIRPFLRVTGNQWKVDEVMVKIRGTWVYLYRAVDQNGKTLDFMVSPRRNKTAAKRFFKSALSQPKNTRPHEVNVDKHAAYPPAFERLKRDGDLPPRSRLKQSKYENNILEQDHRHIQKIVRKALGFFTTAGAIATISCAEVIHMLRKNQTRRGLPTGLDRAKFLNEILQVPA